MGKNLQLLYLLNGLGVKKLPLKYLYLQPQFSTHTIQSEKLLFAAGNS